MGACTASRYWMSEYNKDNNRYGVQVECIIRFVLVIGNKATQFPYEVRWPLLLCETVTIFKERRRDVRIAENE